MTAPSSVPELTPAQRKSLKARAHPLHPVVTIGAHGLTQAVLREIDISLKSHELIKVKMASGDRAARQACLAQVCEALGAQPVQQIGKILVLYRHDPDAPQTPPAPVKGTKRTPARARSTGRAGAARAAAAPAAGRPTRTAPGSPRRARRTG